MAIPGTDDTQAPPALVPSALAPPALALPVRPSWETAPRPAAPRPAPPSAATRPPEPPASAPAASPYYAAPAAAPAPAAFVPSLDPNVRYDLAGNAIPGSGPDVQPPLGSVVYSPGPAAGSWPPPPTSSAYGRTIGDDTDRVAKLRWNWGAFLIPFWWSLFNGQRGIASAVVLINVASRWIPAPYDWGMTAASLGIMVYLGLMGHKLAWSSDRFGGDYDNFIRTQRAWMIWGLSITGVLVIVFIGVAVTLPGFIRAFNHGGTAPLYHHSYSSGDGTGQ